MGQFARASSRRKISIEMIITPSYSMVKQFLLYRFPYKCMGQILLIQSSTRSILLLLLVDGLLLGLRALAPRPSPRGSDLLGQRVGLVAYVQTTSLDYDHDQDEELLGNSTTPS